MCVCESHLGFVTGSVGDDIADGAMNLSQGDLAKLRYTLEAIESGSYFTSGDALTSDAQKAIAWQSKLSAAEIIELRENIVTALECADADQRVSGECENWFARASSAVLEVSRETNGLLCEQLAAVTMYSDSACVDLLRDGARLLGLLTRSGIGEPCKVETS